MCASHSICNLKYKIPKFIPVILHNLSGYDAHVYKESISFTWIAYLSLKWICFLATMSPTMSADLSTLFDVGGIIGAIAAGVISDYSGMSATTCVGMLALAAPMVSH